MPRAISPSPTAGEEIRSDWIQLPCGRRAVGGGGSVKTLKGKGTLGANADFVSYLFFCLFPMADLILDGAVKMKTNKHV